MRSRFVATLAVALTSLGVFAGTASAGSVDSVHSIFNSQTGGTCFAASNTPAGYNARSAAIQYWPSYFYCGYEF